MIARIETAFLRLQFTSRLRLRVYRKLVRFLRNGVTLSDALDIMWEHVSDDGKKPKAVQAVAIDAWRHKVRNGTSFARAVQGWVPEADRIVIEAGEESGRLDIAIENAIFIHEGARKIKNALIAGISYPGFLVAVAIGFMVLFGIEVVPAFETVLPRENWTGVAAQMAAMSDFVQSYLAPLLAALASLGGAVVWSMPRWTGRLRAVADRFPPWSLYRLTSGAGFLLSVSGMVKAGVAIPNILRILQRRANPWYMERISRTLAHVKNGHNIGEALYRTGLGFPDLETVKDLRSYAPLNGFDEILETLGREWMDDSVLKVQQQTKILLSIALILLGAVFGWCAVGIFSLQQQLVSGL